MAERHTEPHCEVDDINGHEWARCLYEQETKQAQSVSVAKVMEFWEAHKDHICDRFTIATGQPCGGKACIRAFNDGPLNARLFLGCTRWKGRESGHICIPLANYDIGETLRVWGQDNVDVHEDILEAIGFQWEEEASEAAGIYLYMHETINIIVGTNMAECHYVIANLQGNKKTQECPYYHDINGGGRARGKIIQHVCDVKLYFIVPTFENGVPSTNKMALVCIGKHTHPPPPARKIPAKVKVRFIKVFHQFGLTDVTARKLLASPLLPILLDGKTTLSIHHLALTNMDAVNHLIRKERLREHPFGTDILGVQHFMSTQITASTYIRQAIQFDDGHFVVICQHPQQSHFFYIVSEIHADKTFSRNRCREFEINSYNPGTQTVVTCSRVWTDYEDTAGYYQAFRLVFDTAENDVGRPIRWAHLLQSEELTEQCIKAVLVDEHGGQMKGLGQYFHEKYPIYTADEHIPKIAKVCQTHYFRSITKMAKKGLSKGISP